MNAVDPGRTVLADALPSAAIVGAMAALLGAVGWLIAGTAGLAAALGACAGLVLINPSTSPRLLLRLGGARPLPEWRAPWLHGAVRALSRRAGLPRVPALHVVPGNAINAFAVGSREEAAIGVTEGLLARLDREAAAGVLAHEIGHLVNGDLWVMGLAGSFARVTELMSIAGQTLLVLSLPAVLLGAVTVNWAALALLTLAPTLSLLLQLGLSRVREYAADREAARLCGSARPLARALAIIDRAQGRFLERLLPRADLEPRWLRTHPPTGERIRRLLALEPGSMPPALAAPAARRPAPAGRPARSGHRLARPRRIRIRQVPARAHG